MQWKVVTFLARDIQAGGENKMMFSLLIIRCFCPDCAVMSSDSKDCNVQFDFFSSKNSFSFQQLMFLLLFCVERAKKLLQLLKGQTFQVLHSTLRTFKQQK